MVYIGQRRCVTTLDAATYTAVLRKFEIGIDVLLILGIERQQYLTLVLLNLSTSARAFPLNVRCLPRRCCGQ